MDLHRLTDLDMHRHPVSALVQHGLMFISTCKQNIRLFGLRMGFLSACMPAQRQPPRTENCCRRRVSCHSDPFFGLTLPFRLTYKMCLLIPMMFVGALGQCKQYANSGAPATEPSSGSTTPTHGECLQCASGYSLQNKECVPEQGFDLAKLPGLIVVICVAGCIMVCLIAHLIQKRCRQMNKKPQQEGASSLAPVDPHTNTLSHQQWSCRISRLCSFKVFTASERNQKLQEIARSSRAPPVMPYQVSQPNLQEFTETIPSIPLPAPVHDEENPAIQSIQFLDVGQDLEQPNLSPVDDVMIVLANPPAQVFLQPDQKDGDIKQEGSIQEISGSPRIKSARKDYSEIPEDCTKLASDFTKVSSQLTSGFNPTRATELGPATRQTEKVPREESWKAEEA